MWLVQLPGQGLFERVRGDESWRPATWAVMSLWGACQRDSREAAPTAFAGSALRPRRSSRRRGVRPARALAAMGGDFPVRARDRQGDGAACSALDPLTSCRDPLASGRDDNDGPALRRCPVVLTDEREPESTCASPEYLHFALTQDNGSRGPRVRLLSIGSHLPPRSSG